MAEIYAPHSERLARPFIRPYKPVPGIQFLRSVCLPARVVPDFVRITVRHFERSRGNRLRGAADEQGLTELVGDEVRPACAVAFPVAVRAIAGNRQVRIAASPRSAVRARIRLPFRGIVAVGSAGYLCGAGQVAMAVTVVE